MWPKWLLGDEGQACLRLPRGIHNMSGVGLDDGGFHQRLNALFAASSRFEGLTVEDKREFGDALAAAKRNGELDEFLADARDLLLEAYTSTVCDPSVLGPVKTMLEVELRRIEDSAR